MKSKKSWKEKLLNSKNLPRVEKISEKMEKRWGKGSVAIPSPKEIDDIMRMVPEGKVITFDEIREFLAKKYNATLGCPITTGLFACIAANASIEDENNGIKDINPYWRTLKSGGFLNEKYPGGIARQKERLEKEGHSILSKGKKYFVENYKEKLFKL
ncbi:MAG TPA: MGMT family protein [Spirochaetota bacterium]|nr:MGMT family protein [Spirochaetota bacterium]HOL57773.1 MGMT family protein [Spirochaetota bacterium]HPP05308.1 MGMT family protein [Spirochaetota bacterium]